MIREESGEEVPVTCYGADAKPFSNEAAETISR